MIASRYLDEYITGKLDRLDVVYTKFESMSRQHAVIETLLPLGAIGGESSPASTKSDSSGRRAIYEFLPSPESILEEVVPASFKIKLFKCFLDSAVSEQIARMVAMRGATQNADDLAKSLTRQYNRARQPIVRTYGRYRRCRSPLAKNKQTDHRPRPPTSPMATATETKKNIGRITQIIGSTFDVEYEEGSLPAIYNAVKIVSDHKGVKINLTGEVQQHLGGGRVRCVRTAPTASSAVKIASTPASR